MFTFLHTVRVYFLGNKCNLSADDIFINFDMEGERGERRPRRRKSGYKKNLLDGRASILNRLTGGTVCNHMHAESESESESKNASETLK